MEPPHLVTRPHKVVGGEKASIAHPWNLWGVERIFTQDKTKVPQTGMEWQGQSSELVRPRVDLEEYVTLYSFTWDYSISLGLFAATVHHILGILIEARDMVPMCCFVAKIHVVVR
jgi:hypothetical protein